MLIEKGMLLKVISGVKHGAKMTTLRLVPPTGLQIELKPGEMRFK